MKRISNVTQTEYFQFIYKGVFDINTECINLTFDDPNISLVIGDASLEYTEAEIMSYSNGYI